MSGGFLARRRSGFHYHGSMGFHARSLRSLPVAALAGLAACSSDGPAPGPGVDSRVASIQVLPPPTSLTANESIRLTAIALTSSGAAPATVTLAWRSSNASVASVTQGVVTGHSVGTAEIFAEADGKSGSVFVDVVATELVMSTDRYADGTIGFTSTRNGGHLDVFSIGPGGVRRITTSADHDHFDGWSPDGLRMALIHFPTGAPTFSSHVINSDGTGEVLIAPGLVNWAPDWLYRGSIIDGRVVIAKADGSAAIPVGPTAPAYEILGPWWSPDGTRAAFAHMPSATTLADIYVVNADGSGLRNITNTPLVAEEFASWDATGTRLAFTAAASAGGLGSSVFTMNADGSAIRRLTTQSFPRSDLEPQWSPAGRLIAYTTNVGLGYSLSLVNPDNAVPMRITPTTIIAGFAKWSADGKRLAFPAITDQSFRQDVYVMTVDRRQMIRLSQGTGDNLGPFWRP